MSKRSLFLTASLLAAGAFLTIPQQPVRAQASKQVVPERALLGVRLGRPFLEVIRKFGQPSEVQTVALAVSQDQLPSLGGMSGPGMEGSSGYPGGMGAYPGGMGAYPGGAAPFGGGSPFGGVPTLPPAGGASSGFGAPGGYPGGMGMPGYPGAPGGFGGYPGAGPEGSSGYPGAPGAAGAAQGPEYSNAILWIYKRQNGVRLEFLINEDGRVAQISVAAPAGKTFPNSKTSRNVALGSTLNKVMESYGYPERHRMLPGLRFYEVYYTKNHHAAFTLDTTDKTGMKVVRITIALAD